MKDTPAGLGDSELSGALADGWQHVAAVVASGELDRLRKTIEVLPDAELVRELRQAWPMHAPDGCSPPSRSRLTSPPAGPLTNNRA